MKNDFVKREIRKAFFGSPILLLLIALLFIKGCILFSDSGRINTVVEANRNGYQNYMKTLEGELTKEKATFLESRYEDISNTDKALYYLAADLKEGKITQKEYHERYRELSNLASERGLFNLLYNEYQYVSSDPQHRYFLYKNGWLSLLAAPGMDLLLMFPILIFCSSLFCDEYASGMDPLLLASSYGRTRLFRIKLLFSILFSLLLSALWSGMEYFHFSSLYELPHPEYPLQSLTLYGGSYLTISLRGALFLVWFFRFLGCVLLSFLTIFASVICKKYLLAFSCGALSVLLPHFAFDPFMLFSVPNPLGLWTGGSYLCSNSSGVSSTGFFLFPFLSLSLIFILYFLSQNIYLYRRPFGTFPGKRLAEAALLFVLCCSFGGCSSDADYYYSSDFSDYAYANGMLIRAERDMPTVLFLKEEEERKIPEALFPQNTIIRSSVSSYNGEFYYSLTGKTTTTIYRYRAEENFSECFCVLGKTNPSIFGSQSWLPASQTSFELLISPVAVKGNWLYYLSSDTLYSYNRLTGRKELLAEQIGGAFALAGDTLCYLNSSGNIEYGKLHNSEKKTVYTAGVSSFASDGRYLYYTEKYNAGSIRVFSCESGEQIDEILTSGTLNYVALRGALFYRDTDCVFRYYPDTKESQLLSEGIRSILTFSADGKELVVQTEENTFWAFETDFPADGFQRSEETAKHRP